MAHRPSGYRRNPAPRRAGLILGMGLGGFADGIALHQILQWHNMGSARLAPTTMSAMKQNMAWDGWFHAGMLLVTLLGIFVLLNDARGGRPVPSGMALVGQMLTGWGAFNLVEGIVDHQVLQLHHVRDVPVHIPLYDWVFLGAGGLGLLILGVLIMRRG
jgi:uncharacterized membrane protein